MSNFSKYFKDCRSRAEIKRVEIGDSFINKIITKIEHNNFVGVNRAQVLRIINLLTISRKERQVLIHLLNNVLPKKKVRLKFDSKGRRRTKYRR